ncbi:hypothetical protein N658DRAFT_278146 [Parathielavia hyrcaniae]|uniref:Uncharacterized protein n=1 Tax=Parathielavia hyrcaniae TaxID=113614 RepID=A0AAN6T3K6_9PEZI|nr:hypothetical protein N658DRAFT_278146 [Parathielavia hyrcaniae]
MARRVGAFRMGKPKVVCGTVGQAIIGLYAHAASLRMISRHGHDGWYGSNGLGKLGLSPLAENVNRLNPSLGHSRLIRALGAPCEGAGFYTSKPTRVDDDSWA